MAHKYSNTVDILEVFVENYRDLFTSTNPSSEDLVAGIHGLISQFPVFAENRFMEPFSQDEIKIVIFDMHPTKATGPDGFSAIFYQKFWDVVGDRVSTTCLNILNGNESVATWNDTLISLIPKIVEPSHLKDFCPISLCNFIYKIVAKALSNRITPDLSLVIDENQSTFIAGRQRTYNITVGFDCNHWLRDCTQGKDGYGALKLDMSKAYDIIEWAFLR